ncbi:MAG TPA: AAA family ATPase, partial [Acidimicrobiales bacterium]|nr:AAA family ATPase [Acidimicrobiales bacterium]
GTGKSTLARALAGEMGAVVLRSDEVRKELAGIDRGQAAPAPLDEGLYRPSATAATYAELLERARRRLGGGETVVLDASWRDRAWRDRAVALARETCSDLVELRCVAPLDVAVARVRERARGGGDPSDATPEVVRAMAGAHDGWDSATVVDTSGAPGAAAAAALAAAGWRTM